MTRRGHRSAVSIQRREAERIVGPSAYRDREIGETVNTLSAIDVLVKVTQALGDYSPHVFNQYERGEVRTEPRGEGSTQYPERLEALKDDPRG